ncbi:MAG: phosphatidylserine synthase, partial [Chloroflexi bacterium]|nr:phosphatidylserine synthase [Chloroflexota bacterium]
MIIALPAFRVSCNVGIDRGRAWSIVDEVILWALAQKSRTIAQLASESQLPRQLVVASIARLMRFRLLELTVQANGAAFRPSAYGKEIVSSGRPLPFFPKRETKRVSFVIEQATGGYFPSAQVRLTSQTGLDNEADPDLRVIQVEGGGPSMSHESNLARLSRIAVRGWEEQVAIVDGRTASIKNEFMLIRVVDGVPRNVPDGASETLKRLIREVSRRPQGPSRIPVGYVGPGPDIEPAPAVHDCSFDPDDLLIGGPAQLASLRTLLKQAHSRVVIHSTFLDHRRFRDLMDDIREACIRGVSFDLLWGAEPFDEDDVRNATAAVEIARLIREDRDLARRFRIHMRSTGSHAKLLLTDTPVGDWVAAVGSCNWFSTPFVPVEITAVLRDPHVVADVAVALQRMVGRRALSDDIATEMSNTAKELRRQTRRGGPARISLVLGDGHDALMRRSSGEVRRRLVVGSHRLGSTARPGVVLPGEAAAGRSEIEVTLLYTQTSGPLRNRHARKL